MARSFRTHETLPWWLPPRYTSVRGPELPGSACPLSLDQRHDAFLLNDRHRSSRSHPPSIVSTGRVSSARRGQRRTSCHPGTEGPSASTRPGRIYEQQALSISSSPRPEPNYGLARAVHTAIASNAHPAEACSASARTEPDPTVPTSMLQSARTTHFKRHRLVPADRPSLLQRHRASPRSPFGSPGRWIRRYSRHQPL